MGLTCSTTMMRTLISLSSHASRGQRRSRTISVNMVIQLVLADDDKPTFALLTKLHLSETVITDDEGGYVSQRGHVVGLSSPADPRACQHLLLRERAHHPHQLTPDLIPRVCQ
ncbi:Os07g0547400 [Oryza sativa Japonica Group]|uniref:Os07g0547400 protein n=1 Tax=Oryza sativa subsp. japonica TaxID=39947 RepID=A0A0P0X813_ORYSJ|nr:Os07g0547400 [Oryza sativa Japonica Group]